jgi:hypothetical protein
MTVIMMVMIIVIMAAMMIVMVVMMMAAMFNGRLNPLPCSSLSSSSQTRIN